jgi:hypothetical protein
MQIVPIQAIPNQKFFIVLDGNQWDIGIRTTNGCISVSASLNGNPIMENMRAVAGTRVIPSKYQEAGNFVFITQNYEIPDYINFGVTQFLIYISQAELDAVRDRDPHIITAADFDPNGDLPQSFSPQGYRLAS